MSTSRQPCEACKASAIFTNLKPLQGTRVVTINNVSLALCAAHSAEIKQWAEAFGLTYEVRSGAVVERRP